MPVPYAQSPALGAVRHGFFGRAGGHSSGDFASLNVSESTGDDPELVARNRAAAADELGFAPEALVTLRQTHSTIVETVTDAPSHERHEGDAMVTNVPGLVLGILTADCAPVLLADAEAGVVGAFHAGWKGAIGGIPQATVVAMTARGADPDRIVAVIGPTISGRNYEVGPDFAANLLARHPGAAGRISMGPAGREHFDLPGFVADQLRAAGIAKVEDLALCTYADPDRFFSHRYATHRRTRTGRQIALIGLP